jgi:hypothetical protein
MSRTDKGLAIFVGSVVFVQWLDENTGAPIIESLVFFIGVAVALLASYYAELPKLPSKISLARALLMFLPVAMFSAGAYVALSPRKQHLGIFVGCCSLAWFIGRVVAFFFPAPSEEAAEQPKPAKGEPS